MPSSPRSPSHASPESAKSLKSISKNIGIRIVADLRNLDTSILEASFGRHGIRLYELAHGIDNNPVIPNRPTQSISAEDTFESDILLADTEPMIRRLAEKVWAASQKESRTARTIVLKLKTADFSILTRSHTPTTPPSSCAELTKIALGLRDRVNLDPHRRFRLVGVGLGNFRDPEEEPTQPPLFDPDPPSS